MNNDTLAPEPTPSGDLNPVLEPQDLPQHAGLLEHDSPIFLVGMMGAGKTTIGKALARVLNREFIDLDHELEARCGVRIPVIFEIEGEQGFRKRECQVLDDCTVKPNIVMATGGGAVLAEENRLALKSRGIVLYLRASVEELYRRTSRDRNRPLLATPDPKATLRTLLGQREPLYESVADIVVDTGTTSVNHLVAHIVERLQSVNKQIDHGAQSRPGNSSASMRADFAATHPEENKPCTP
ncbi:shikimate kinase [Zwartia vadi]|uniref:shikimate kinase n=1 Tax=Zwartia vadi TaxID=3058168 RepID=UPI0025B3032D|nr:shikimate kinase [Zwartia vadi]MDN3988178.1 shikimate kinase [Zwartia vadi]